MRAEQQQQLQKKNTTLWMSGQKVESIADTTINSTRSTQVVNVQLHILCVFDIVTSDRLVLRENRQANKIVISPPTFINFIPFPPNPN